VQCVAAERSGFGFVAGVDQYVAGEIPQHIEGVQTLVDLDLCPITANSRAGPTNVASARNNRIWITPVRLTDDGT
jgi:hypothetical protein